MDQFIEFIGNHYILSSVWLALFFLLLFGLIQDKISPVARLSVQEATILMNRENAVVVDIRNQEEFKKGHILGATQLSSGQVSKKDFKSLEKYKDNTIIVVCAGGITASGVANSILKSGFEKVAILTGGMNAWLSANLPVSKK